MKRLAKVVARSHHRMTLQLIKAEKCINCPANCNEPLVDLFALRKNLFTLSKQDSQYHLIDPNNLFTQPRLLDQLVNINIDQHDLMKSSAVLYLLPLTVVMLTLTLGHFLGQWLNVSNDLTALAGFVIGLMVVYKFSQAQTFTKPLKFRPKVTIL